MGFWGNFGAFEVEKGELSRKGARQDDGQDDGKDVGKDVGKDDVKDYRQDECGIMMYENIGLF